MKILWISDFDLRGSGYLNISAPICDGLALKGHEVKVVGLLYKGEEHNFNFSLIPADNLFSGLRIVELLYPMWRFDVMVVALDVPVQGSILSMSPQALPFSYIGIFPIESDPLNVSSAAILLKMNRRMIISKFGIEEAKKLGIDADYLQIGIDTNAWRVPTSEEKSLLRSACGLDQDNFIILTVADNQERKNLASGMEIISNVKKHIPNLKYILVTREHAPIGWNLRDYAQELGIHQDIMIFERGMAFKDLWSLYAISDVFFLPSKAEGLGMPLLEAMATGLTPVGTNCTAIAEVLGEGRGILVGDEYQYRDPFGNQRRYLIDKKQAAEVLIKLAKGDLSNNKQAALEYVQSRKWQTAVDQVEKVLSEAVEANNEEKIKETTASLLPTNTAIL